MATAHVPQHAFGSAYYALKSVAAAESADAGTTLAGEQRWQLRRVPDHLRDEVRSRLRVHVSGKGIAVRLQKGRGFQGGVIANLKMNPTNPLDFLTPALWRRWLQRNHAKSQGEWVYVYKKNAKTGLRYQDALDEALCFGWIDGQIHAVDEQRFRQRWTPRRPGSVWSQANKDRVKRLVAEGRMCAAGLASVREARKNGKWRAAYTNRRPETVPADLVKALRADPAAWRNFRSFARTYRNMYAGWVVSARREETRQRRIEAVVRRAADGRKPGVSSLYE